MKNEPQSQTEREIEGLLDEMGIIEIGDAVPADQAPWMFINPTIRPRAIAPADQVEAEAKKITPAGRVQDDGSMRATNTVSSGHLN